MSTQLILSPPPSLAGIEPPALFLPHERPRNAAPSRQTSDGFNSSVLAETERICPL